MTGTCFHNIPGGTQIGLVALLDGSNDPANAVEHVAWATKNEQLSHAMVSASFTNLAALAGQPLAAGTHTIVVAPSSVFPATLVDTSDVVNIGRISVPAP
jgi:hypothetical protein